MDERKEFIEKWHRRNDSFADLCRQFGVARKTGYKWVERFKRGGWPELEDAGRAPQNSPQALAEAQADEIVGFRQQHPNWGARKIREYFQREKPGRAWPAASTIHALLHREGLIADRKKRRKTPPYTRPLQHAGAPNQVGCADFKGWFRCRDGVRCDPLTITDAHSRYLLRCRAVSKADGIHVRAMFEAVFGEYGVPEAIRTDNGAPFASTAPAGLSRLSMWWLQLAEVRHEGCQKAAKVVQNQIRQLPSLHYICD